jgi:hypothetical protein
MNLSCRTGPLRAGRSLRDLYTGLGGTIFDGPPVGRDHYFPTNGRADAYFLPRQVKKAC